MTFTDLNISSYLASIIDTIINKIHQFSTDHSVLTYATCKVYALVVLFFKVAPVLAREPT